MKQHELNKQIKQLNQDIQIDEKKISRYGLFRLLFLFALFLTLCAAWKEKMPLFYLAALLFLGGFLLTAHYQNCRQLILQRRQAQLILNQALMARKEGKWFQEKKDSGDSGAYYLADLDVLGQNSLYDYLNFSPLSLSQAALKSRLSHPLKSYHAVQEVQEALLELVKTKTAKNYLVEETVCCRTYHPIRAGDLEALTAMPLYLKYWTYFYPIALACFAAARLWQAAFWLIFIGIGMSLFHFRYWQEAAQKAALQIQAAKTLSHLARCMTEQKLQNSCLQKKQTIIAALLAQQKNIERIDQLFKFRYNPLLLLLLDGLFFYDGWLYRFFEHQSKPDYLLQLQDELGDYGALCSMAMWYEIKERTTLPMLGEQLVAEDLKHPLMTSEQAVGADFHFKPGAVVITGSNMAGKTTFMRNIGLNLVLFYSGLSVDAKHFEAPLLDIYTSMRVADRMQEGISTFYGELMRIKEMIAAADQERQAIYLIDEIFKGTNLKDRIIGAKAVIEKLDYPHAFLFVSTHDEELCCHEHVEITNVHFSEYYQDGKIYFDYQLKPGTAKTTNAKFLMRMIGLLA